MSREGQVACLVDRILELADADGDGYLDEGELLQLVRHMNWHGSTDEWTELYPRICSENTTDPGIGVDATSLASVLEKYNCGLGELPLQQGPQRAPSLFVLLEDLHEMMEESRQFKQLVHELFIAFDLDVDGRLNEPELGALAKHFGWGAWEPPSEWAEDYVEICSRVNVDPTAGVDLPMLKAILANDRRMQETTGANLIGQRASAVMLPHIPGHGLHANSKLLEQALQRRRARNEHVAACAIAATYRAGASTVMHVPGFPLACACRSVIREGEVALASNAVHFASVVFLCRGFF